MSTNEHGQRLHGDCPNCKHTGKDCLCWLFSNIDPAKAAEALRQIYEVLFVDTADEQENLQLNPNKEWDADHTEAISNIVAKVIPTPIDMVTLPKGWENRFKPLPGLDFTGKHNSLKCPICGKKAAHYREDISNDRTVQGMEEGKIVVEGLYNTENLDDGDNPRFVCPDGHGWPVTARMAKKIDFI